ncbi:MULTISPECIES: MocR-like pyridoxine biosynthesis transcription factor PdxR [Chryseobacterium]|uniref:GntR family transcriptional regulator/MocR family aminotransferase n=1 Tax=Chryseobacterium camelliae TaxID=1265445 RepID=A0ABU0TGR5_9FLAO|nr:MULTISPECIES: PLP-dependent aminotransferase family protein [Chryseobacterium]MDT3405954.1 GntR family transcriptional regulator/MocR family aminotransferase [Pseudacidovorax intermedius]MDQ1096242.1 GntR family transcriptional regulator/MocR family aminotransferase [Chryseobacterium camelliae]MDQ1100179.1 GntR family transcriptional regulator/MocR family aminotransferase [Chryseobacterium sp. SORGH_AS_1048]MDR6087523.1 GntR family transcriptional regulator/MocR family aminotransferase [Chry
MDSPVTVPYTSFINIDRKSNAPVYMQISNQLINAIQRGILPAGTKLPGTRSMSQLLTVHRNTIVAAYDELLAQGWIESVPNKGTFVHGSDPETQNPDINFQKNDLQRYPKTTGFTFKHSSILDNPFEKSGCDYIFNDGIPDIRLTQIDQHSRIYSSILKRKAHKINQYNHDGSEFFKENLSRYLNLSRGLPISKNNLLITRSTEMSIYIASQILLAEGDVVLVGELSYFSVNMIFQQSKVAIHRVPVDREGIDVGAVREICSRQKVRMLYLTPHHHYPTTVTLSAQRRLELLRLAATYGFIILEDDYDYDFHYDKSPILPLASADTSGMVIYIGSFGKSLAPGFRTGFIVAPENLMDEMRKYLGIIDRQGDILMEQVLGEMIAEGEIHRYLKKSVKVYRERKEAFTLLLEEYLGNYIQFEQPSGGLAIWAEWKAPVNLMQLSRLCAQNNLFIPKTLLYQNRNLTAMRLGFGNLNQQEMEHSVRILSECAADLI